MHTSSSDLAAVQPNLSDRSDERTALADRDRCFAAEVARQSEEFIESRQYWKKMHTASVAQALQIARCIKTSSLSQSISRHWRARSSARLRPVIASKRNIAFHVRPRFIGKCQNVADGQATSRTRVLTRRACPLSARRTIKLCDESSSLRVALLHCRSQVCQRLVDFADMN